MSFLRALYTFSIAVLVLAFVVFGGAALPAPQPPDVPAELQNEGENPTEEQQALLTEQGQQQQVFQTRISTYHQVVSFVVIGIAIALLAVSILWLRRIVIIGDAVALGGVFTLLYGLYYAVSLGGGVLTFVAVLVGLVVLISL